ncbi:2722_t:CDS:2, partial [Scutellospora calospora]
KIKRFLLDLIHFKSNHTAERTKEKLLWLCDEMKIRYKIISLTMDNYSAMVVCRELLENIWNQFEFMHYRCAAHVLNIAVSYGIQYQTPLIDKYITPKIDVIIRWNSIYNMLYRFKLMHTELNLLVTKYKLRDIFLNNDEFKEIDDLLNLLYPILEATVLLSSSSYPTMSDIRLSFKGVLHHLSRFIDDRSYSLDKSIVQYIPQAFATNAGPSKNRKREFFKSLLEQQQLINEPPVEELDLYLSSPPCSEEDPLEYILCEKAFLVAARTVTKIHNCLHPETTCTLLCLKSWMEQGIGEQTEK